MAAHPGAFDMTWDIERSPKARASVMPWS